MFEEDVVDSLKHKLHKRTCVRQRLSFDDQDRLFVMYVSTLTFEERLRLLRVCAMRGYIGHK